MSSLRWGLLVCGTFVVAAPAWALGEYEHGLRAEAGKKQQQPWGVAGDQRDVSRTIEVGMSDRMRFEPSVIRVRLGQTVRFVMRNHGKLMHEMVIGTKEVLDEHAAMMRKSPHMEHDDAHAAHVAPGERGQILWKFNRRGEFDYACLIPGHYESGMVGRIIVVAA